MIQIFYASLHSRVKISICFTNSLLNLKVCEHDMHPDHIVHQKACVQLVRQCRYSADTQLVQPPISVITVTVTCTFIGAHTYCVGELPALHL